LVVEGAVGGLWAFIASGPYPDVPGDFMPLPLLLYIFATRILQMCLVWLLVALAALDAEHLWLPNFLTIIGAAIGLTIGVVDPFILFKLDSITGLPLTEGMEAMRFGLWAPRIYSLGSVIAAAGLILLIRWFYWLFRRREGMGLGDAKLMAMLGAWLGLPGALLAFGLGVVLAALFALGLLAVSSARKDGSNWALRKLPLGTFLCIGGIVSSLWGQRIIAAYIGWAGF
jgi:leader peptidase (prepilin peptidase)/N-methyltransferase